MFLFLLQQFPLILTQRSQCLYHHYQIDYLCLFDVIDQQQAALPPQLFIKSLDFTRIHQHQCNLCTAQFGLPEKDGFPNPKEKLLHVCFLLFYLLLLIFIFFQLCDLILRKTSLRYVRHTAHEVKQSLNLCILEIFCLISDRFVDFKSISSTCEM